MPLDLTQFAKTNNKKTTADIKYLRFHKEKYPVAFKLISEFNRSYDLEKLVEAYLKKEVLPALTK